MVVAGPAMKGGEVTPQPSSLIVASLPWVFTQHHPMDTNEFEREARQRGAELNEQILRALYMHRLLIPFVAIRPRRVSDPITESETEPLAAGQRKEFRHARDQERLLDLVTVPCVPRRRFDYLRRAGSEWWNGLVDGVEPSDPKEPLRAAPGYIAACREAHQSQHGQIFARLTKCAARSR